MSKSNSKINSSAAINAISLKYGIRSMLRRNLSLLDCNLGKELDSKERKRLMTDTESMAAGFAFILSILVTYMTDEEICDFLDGWKHVITNS